MNADAGHQQPGSNQIDDTWPGAKPLHHSLVHGTVDLQIERSIQP